MAEHYWPGSRPMPDQWCSHTLTYIIYIIVFQFVVSITPVEAILLGTAMQI